MQFFLWKFDFGCMGLQGRPRGEMTVEERIEAADRRKVDGNDLFKEGKIAAAMQQYEMVTLSVVYYLAYA